MIVAAVAVTIAAGVLLFIVADVTKRLGWWQPVFIDRAAQAAVIVALLVAGVPPRHHLRGHASRWWLGVAVVGLLNAVASSLYGLGNQVGFDRRDRDGRLHLRGRARWSSASCCWANARAASNSSASPRPCWGSCCWAPGSHLGDDASTMPAWEGRRRGRLDGLPGAELVGPGLDDLAAGRVTEAAMLATIAAPRLREPRASGCRRRPSSDPDLQLYDLVEARVGPARAHATYNALRRRLTSFLRSLDAAPR